jgi:Lon protease-like protein
MLEVGVFPLGMVLLPTEQLPLHIFEPRYRELIGECIEETGEFGMVYEDETGVRDIGTLADVAEVVHRFEDGRLNVVVAGRRRFRLLDWTEGRSFRTAEIEPVDDEYDLPDADVAERGVRVFRRLAEQAGADVEPPAVESPLLSFELAARIDLGASVKQELLESHSERERLSRVVELLERAMQTIAVEREVADRASRNGKVFTPRD